MRIVLAIVFSAQALTANAQIFKCPDAAGRLTFSDKPCAGAAESPQHQIDVQPPPVSSDTIRQRRAEEQDEARWEEAKRFYYVDIPQLERQAIELMASPDPARQALGQEMAWQVQKGREAFKRLERSRKVREETERRYDDTLRRIRGY
ncbi:DUF4124 domain-containing protein [Pseudomonas indica]|uniref:DUF4124 domain-containing protein n=1 Tax=Pseudomonas indica TaxID=137658 RepID=UPI003FD12476